ncbi:MAG: hypothetical protein KAT16_03555 [Candidatus Heimdallarchaeota archaeon]|nr:hypothetical protein [Candidatus Heimdallarchaeota archaeon]
MVKKLLTINPEFPGYWKRRKSSNLIKSSLRFDVILTILIFGLVSVEILFNLSVVTAATLFITSVSIIFCLLNYEKYPLVTIPLSQIIAVFLVGYIHLIITNSLTRSRLIPEPINLVLGILITLRVFIGMFIIRMHLHYSKARVPVSKNIQDSLHLFETHLKLTETKIEHEFNQEPFSNLLTFFRNIFAIFVILGILLIPLWMNMVLNILIYPYILLIPSILLVLLILILYLQRKQ